MELTDEQRKENLIKMMDFFGADLNIKKILLDIAPKSMDTYNSESMIEYSDRRYEAVRDIEYYFEKMSEIAGLKDDIKTKVKEIKSRVEQGGYSESEIKKTYQECFSDMSQEFIK